MGISRSCASSFTGDPPSFCPRPRARSGCVSESTTGMFASSNARRSPAANAGVPAKPTFIGRSSAREPLLFAEPRRKPRALECRKVVDEDLALEVLRFVLDANGEHTVRLELERLALRVLRAHENP